MIGRPAPTVACECVSNAVPGPVTNVRKNADVKRDLERLRRVGELLDADIKRALGTEWAVTVSDGPILTMTDGDRTESVLIDGDVAVDNWPNDAWAEPFREDTLDDDASEALAGELFEVVRLWDVPFSACPDHDEALIDVCSMTWTCSGPPEHDLSPLGSLRV